MTTSVLRRAGLVTLPLALTLGLAACGGSGGGGGDSARPSVSDLINALQSESTSLSPTAAKCLATTMESSSLSDTALEAVIKNDKNYKPDAADKKVINSVKGQLVTCIVKDLPSSAASGSGSGSASAGVGTLP